MTKSTRCILSVRRGLCRPDIPEGCFRIWQLPRCQWDY